MSASASHTHLLTDAMLFEKVQGLDFNLDKADQVVLTGKGGANFLGATWSKCTLDPPWADPATPTFV